MKVILLQDVAKIGKRFEVANVPDGYALNQLIPKRMAEPATPANMKKIERRQAERTASAEASTARFAYDVDETNDMNPIAVLETNMGTIEIELYEDYMPITAGNFKKLVSEGFYDGIKFHRVIDGFMIQGGDPNTKTDDVFSYGKGGPGYTIPDEHIKGEKLSNVRGTISMANSGPESGGSQFFINLIDNTRLDFDQPPLQSQHPVFGQVVAGMDVVDKIAKVETGMTDIPLESVVIERATIKEGE
jgi:peptidylprolyl isomerase